LQVGEKIADRFGEDLKGLSAQGLAELKDFSSAISVPAFCQIMAALELGRRAATTAQPSLERMRITSSDSAIEYCRQTFARLAHDRQQEEFHVVTLDTKKQPIGTHQISVGTLDASLVHPREVFRAAIRDAASSILVVHNHPSGDPTPSPEDFQVMRALTEAGELIGIALLDSIVVAATGCISMRETKPRSRGG
jgi:DNA repair protein RadC